MEEQSALCAARLREKAAQCRKMAFGALSRGVAEELESIAREYETDADNLAGYHGGGLRFAVARYE